MNLKFLNPITFSVGLLAGCADDRLPNTPHDYPDSGRLDFDVPGVDVPYDRHILSRDVLVNDASSRFVDASLTCIPEICDGALLRERQRSMSGHLQNYCVRFRDRRSGIDSNDVINGMTSFDYDGDGDEDILILKRNLPPSLYQNNGDFFSNVTILAGLNGAAISESAAVGDYDGDGHQDLLLVGSHGNILYHNSGSSFHPVPDAFSSRDTMLHSRAAAFIASTLLFGTEEGTRAYRYESGRWMDVTSISGLEDRAGEAYEIAVTLIGGAHHVYVANPTGRNRHFVETGGRFESVELMDGTVASGESVSAQWVFYQGEEYPSLSVGNYSDGNYFFVRSASDAGVAGVDGGAYLYHDLSSSLGIRDPGPTSTVRWGDFAQDRRPWLFVGRYQNPSLGRSYPNLLYIPVLNPLNGTVVRYVDVATSVGLATLSSPSSPPEWMHTLAVHMSDYNGDALLDIAMAYNTLSENQGGIRVFQNASGWVNVCESGISDAGVGD